MHLAESETREIGGRSLLKKKYFYATVFVGKLRRSLSRMSLYLKLLIAA
jgi:hypothetical protein